MAQRVLQDKIDLAVCLSPEDCEFLAQNFWIFTVDQLAYFVCESDPQVSAAATESSAGQPSTKSEFLTKVSFLMQPDDEQEHKKARTDDLPMMVASKAAESVPSTIGGSQVSDGATSAAPSIAAFTRTLDSKTVDQPSDPTLLCKENEEIDEVDKPGGASSTSGVVRKVSDAMTQKAKNRLLEWGAAVRKFRQDNARHGSSTKETFRIEGAIQVLFPTATQNFLKSIGIETLWGFLSLRKQENAPICNTMNTWRMSCGIMKPVTSFTLSKHLCGVANRVETAISSIPPVAEEVMLWMKGPINCLSGAARDFVVVDQGITTVTQFLNMRTKDLATKLEAWRKEKGMEPLKGSGKVAMVSSWKTFTRDLLEVEDHPGKVLDLSNDVEDIGMDAKEESGKKRPRSQNGIDPCSPLHSTEFFVKVLGVKVTDALASAGVLHGKNLFEADCRVGSALYKNLVDFGVVDSASSFVSDIEKWKSLLFEATQQHPEVAREIAQVKPLAKSNGQDAGKPARAKKKSARGKAWTEPEHSNDPFEALSATTKEFLGSIGISTAEEFLSSRSTDVSLEFIKWRVAAGKPPLKGCGAVASVSGWKSIVRKKAQATGL